MNVMQVQQIPFSWNFSTSQMLDAASNYLEDMENLLASGKPRKTFRRKTYTEYSIMSWAVSWINRQVLIIPMGLKIYMRSEGNKRDKTRTTSVQCISEESARQSRL